MNVLPLTILFSSLLAVFFIIAFAVEWVRGRNTSLERESMLPFADDLPPVRRDDAAPKTSQS